MRPLLFTFILLLLVPHAHAAEAPGVDEVVRRHIEARGGYDRIKALDSVVFSDGFYSEPGYTGSGDAFMAVARPFFKVVGNPEKPGGYMEGYDGAAWEWFRDPGIVIRTVGAASGATRRSADVEGPLVDYREKGSTLVLGEPATIGDSATYRLTLTTRDGFARDYFIDRETFLIVAERRSALFHAFGEPITSETRIYDYRPVAGVLFAHHFAETVIGSGAALTEMRWGRIQAHHDLAESWFSPPDFERTRFQAFLEHLYVERTDTQAVMWTYHDFRRLFPEVDTRAGVELIGYQMLKMGSPEQAISLLEANARDHADSATSHFGLGRALASADRSTEARVALKRALALDPDHQRAAAVLEDLETEDGL